MGLSLTSGLKLKNDAIIHVMKVSNNMTSRNYPKFSDLPLHKDGPHGNAWGLWGPDDQLGTLNLLTDDVIAKAASENIITGQRISLKSVLVHSKMSDG